ncbi:hypothetical protein V8G54_012058 [Vigna mungo]|uniref:Uncharacterized protein n=1 Tax=Vigna mungo TaxID=3915 RepID=A0AAQ3S1W1_VIGMU
MAMLQLVSPLPDLCSPPVPNLHMKNQPGLNMAKKLKAQKAAASRFAYMEENIANLERMEEMYNLQQLRHQELLDLQVAQHDHLCDLISNLDDRLTNIESHLDEEYDNASSEEF